MIGKHEVVVQNARLQYKFSLERSITILRGDSATGKTTLIEMIAAYQQNGLNSGVTIHCDKHCAVLTALYWQQTLEHLKDSIVFIDEGDPFIRTQEFAVAVQKSDNYYVLATRVSLPMLPYSVSEIYGIRNSTSKKYEGTKRLYSSFYPLNKTDLQKIEKPDYVVVEDSNSGFEFYQSVCAAYGISCLSAKGKSVIYNIVSVLEASVILVIADGAAFGAEFEKLYQLKKAKNLIIYLPESFEWMILKSGMIQGVSKILEKPYDYIESSKYFSWERFFTDLLSEKTQGTFRQYHKDHLNSYYLSDTNKNKILSVMPEMNWKQENSDSAQLK